jgi:hypothetical protein
MRVRSRSNRSGAASARRPIVVAGILGALLAVAPAAEAQLLTEGPRNPAAVVSDASFGTSPWTNAGNASASDDASAVSAPGGVPTQYLKANSFGFAIPSPAQIKGIEVAVERRSTAGSIFDARARIVKNNVVGTEDRAMVGLWPMTDEVVVYGSDSDLWGETWTPADINDPGFGFALSATDNVDTAAVDHVTITVHYVLCAEAPAGTCRQPLKSILVVKDASPDTKDKLVWKWVKGESTSQAEFGDPTVTARYALCVYTGAGNALTADLLVPPSASKWTPTSTRGYKYIDKAATESGVQKIVLKASVNDTSKAIVKGRGDALPTITPPLDTPIRVQLVNSDSGVCWEAEFDAGSIKRNQAGSLTAKKQ